MHIKQNCSCQTGKVAVTYAYVCGSHMRTICMINTDILKMNDVQFESNMRTLSVICIECQSYSYNVHDKD